MSQDLEKGSYVEAAVARQMAMQGAGPKRIGNPGPLGLFSFASTTFILSLYNVNARDINTPNVVVGMALFIGGLAQLLAGQWEFAAGNTFGATAFTSYGGFWLSFAMIYMPGTGILDAYSPSSGHASQLSGAIGIYLMTWFVVTFLFLIAVLRTHAGFVALFACLTLTFLLLAVGAFTEHIGTTRGGGALGIITALIAYYVGASGLINKEDSFFTLPVMRFRQE